MRNVTCSDVISSKAKDSKIESPQSSPVCYRAHLIHPTPPSHSPVKLIVVIALATFFIPLLFLTFGQTVEERQSWATTYSESQDQKVASLGQIFRSIHEILAIVR